LKAKLKRNGLCLRSSIPAIIIIICASAASAQSKVLDVGGVLISVSDSRTAQVFHIVDQMSEWDPSVHHEYVRWANKALHLTGEDRELLETHAALRRARGWGNGFEQTFYSDSPIAEAAQRGIANQLITATEAETETKILLHFVPILAGLLDASGPKVVEFRARLQLQSRNIAPVVRKLVHFSETKETLRVPLFLIPNPEEGGGGGGFNGGRLVIEIQKDPDPLPILFHECLHALLWKHKEAIRLAAQSLRLSWVELNEGIAHAFSPGLTDNPQQSDTLSDRLARNFQNGSPATQGYAQSKKYIIALMIRPLLRWSLDHGETFNRFLPKAVNKLKAFNWAVATN